MQKKSFWMSAYVLAASIFLFACEKETPASGTYSSGVFIVNEGPFGNGTGTLDFYSRQKSGLSTDIFAKANNGAVVGNVLQSMTVVGDKALLVVNNANKIWVVGADDFTFRDSVTGLTLPRYAVGIGNNRVAVSEWGAGGVNGAVKIYDLNSRQWRKSIPTGKGAERLLLSGNTLWVVNNGGFDTDSTVVAIDLNTETISKTVSVGVGANSLVQDANGDIWVLAAGAWGAAAGQLVHLRNGVVQHRFSVPQGASQLTINGKGDRLYFAAGNKIYDKDLSQTPPSVWSANGPVFGYLYGLGYDIKTDHLYCADAKNFTTAGTVYIIDANKNVHDSLRTGIIPNGFYFR